MNSLNFFQLKSTTLRRKNSEMRFRCFVLDSFFFSSVPFREGGHPHGLDVLFHFLMIYVIVLGVMSCMHLCFSISFF